MKELQLTVTIRDDDPLRPECSIGVRTRATRSAAWRTVAWSMLTSDQGQALHTAQDLARLLIEMANRHDQQEPRELVYVPNDDQPPPEVPHD